MSEVRIYVEGGRPGDEARFRKAFNAFLGGPMVKARAKRIRWQVIPSKSRNQAYKDFCNALIDHPEDLNLLLVDSEERVAKSGLPWEHLQHCDKWERPSIGDNRCHLMVVTMEAWFIADRETLTKYFHKSPDTVDDVSDVEKLSKPKVEQIMAKVSKGGKFREYDKIADGTKLLETIRPDIVCAKSYHCKRLFDSLIALIDAID